jgi:hypothetical protein
MIDEFLAVLVVILAIGVGMFICGVMWALAIKLIDIILE